MFSLKLKINEKLSKQLHKDDTKGTLIQYSWG